MRSLIALLCLTAPATAWEFTPVPVCTISEDTDEMRVAVTYDGQATEPYTISMVGAPWMPADTFAIQFGTTGRMITTNRHTLTEDGTGLSVSDRGFGNVLSGMAQHNAAIFALGETIRIVPLDGAAEAVAAFEACITAPLS